jgi:hypothetical protein
MDTQPLKAFRVLPGDFDGNGHVDGLDFAYLRQNFGTAFSSADLDGNGFVDGLDFMIFRRFFGTSI